MTVFIQQQHPVYDYMYLQQYSKQYCNINLASQAFVGPWYCFTVFVFHRDFFFVSLAFFVHDLPFSYRLYCRFQRNKLLREHLCEGHVSLVTIYVIW